MGISSSAPWLKYYGDTPHHLDYPSKTIYEMVKAAADQFPKNDAYEFMGKKTTFAQFLQKARSNSISTSRTPRPS